MGEPQIKHVEYWMSQQDWNEVRRLFDLAVQLEGHEVDAFLERECDGHSGIIKQVKLLLQADESYWQSELLAETELGSENLPDHDYPLKPGEIVRAFQVGQVLGKGVSGVVYEASRIQDTDDFAEYQPALPDHVAIKALYPERFDNDGKRRFAREQEALRRLHHPNIARLYDAGETANGIPFLLIERIEGQSLQDLVESSQNGELPIDLIKKVELLIQIASGVQAAHQALILHRDLKPANVMIDRKGRAVLTDFGLARFLGPVVPTVSRTSIGQILGTPQYMAPEQVRSKPPTLATDIYGLGGILYFLLTGKEPFERATLFETCQAVCDEDPIAPSAHDKSIPKDLETICLKSLSKRPEARYQSVETLLHDLNAFLQGRPIAARPVSTLVRLGYWTRRNRALAAISAAAVVGGIISLVTIAVLWRKSIAEAERAQQNMQLAQQTSQQLLAMLGSFTESLKMAEQNPTTLNLQYDLLSSIEQSYNQLPNLDQLEQLDRNVLHDIGVCNYKLGLVQKQLGRIDDFRASTRRAEAIFRRLAKAEPDNAAHWFDIFHCLNNLKLSGEALQTVEKANRLEGGRNKDYRDALAHALFKQALSMIYEGNAAEAERYCQQAKVLIDEILSEDASNWLSWKSIGEFEFIWARSAVLAGDRPLALDRIEASTAACTRALELMPQDRQTIFNIIKSHELAFSIATTDMNLDTAESTLAKLEPWVMQQFQLQSDSLEEFRTTVRFWEASYFLAFLRGDKTQTDKRASSWLKSSQAWLTAYPGDVAAQREHLWVSSVVNRFESQDGLAKLRDQLLPKLSELNPESVNFYDINYTEMLSLFLLGELEECKTRARLHVNWIESNSQLTQPQSEIPYIILGLDPKQPHLVEKVVNSGRIDLLNWKLAAWDLWRHQHRLECLFSERN